MNLNRLHKKAVRSINNIATLTSLTMEEMEKILGRDGTFYCGGGSCYNPNHELYVDDCPTRV
jgi:hypothetical protein